MAAIANGMRVGAPARTAVKPRVQAAPRPRAASREIFFEQEIDNSRVRRQFDPREGRSVLLTVAVFALACAAFVGFAWQQFAVLKDGYTISDLQEKRDALIQANRALELQVASLRSPERITTYASNKLGLTTPKEGQVVRMEMPASGNAEAVMAKLH